MNIIRNKKLYVLNKQNQYEPFHTINEELFLTSDIISTSIYSLYGEDYITAITSPVSKKVIRIYLLNYDETLSRDISEYVSNWNIDINYAQGRTRSGNVTLMNFHNEWTPSPVKQAIWKGTKFKIEIGVYHNSVVFWQNLGIFVSGDISVDKKNRTIDVPIYDKFALLDGTIGGKRINSFRIPAGTPVKTAIQLCLGERKDNVGIQIDADKLPSLKDEDIVVIENILPPSGSQGSVCYVTSKNKYYYFYNTYMPLTGFLFNVKDDSTYRFNGNRYVKLNEDIFDTKPLIFPSSLLDEKTPYTITTDQNCNMGDIIIELANMISCDVCYNTSGSLVISPGAVTNDDLSNKSVVWTYQDGGNQHTQPSYEVQFSKIVNQVIVAGSIENGKQYKAIIVNDNPKSQMNIHMTEPNPLYIEDTNLVGDEYCEMRGKYEMIKQGRLSLQFKFESIYIPHLECNFLVFLYGKKYVINSINISPKMNMSLTVSGIDEVTF